MAAIATDADHMPSLIYSLRGVLNWAPPEESFGADVWGLGYYADGRALTVRKPGDLLEERNFFELAADVKSSVVLAAVHSGAGETMHAPPFRFRRWLFAPTGDLSALSQLQPKILEALPGFIRSEIREATSGELAFAMFLRELHDKALLDDRNEGEPLADAMKRTLDVMHRLAGEAGIDAPSASFSATNGHVVLAARSGPALHWKRQEGLEAIPEGPLDDELHNVQLVVQALKRFRAIVVCAGMEDSAPADWTEIEDGGVFWADRSRLNEPE